MWRGFLSANNVKGFCVAGAGRGVRPAEIVRERKVEGRDEG